MPAVWPSPQRAPGAPGLGGLGRFPFKAAKLLPLMQLVSWRPSKHSEGAFAVADSGLDRAYLGGGLGGCGVGFLPWQGAVRLTLGQW